MPRRLRLAACLLIVLGVAGFTYLRDLGEPAKLFWDENYHVASAQKYLHGVFFMAPHPPLGKLLIALGAASAEPNDARDASYTASDYVRQPPPGSRLGAYRFVPALFAWAAAGNLFLVFYLVSQRLIFALALSSLYIFDNALIVHNRGAMLEGPILFFATSCILLFLLLPRLAPSPRRFGIAALLFGAFFGCLVATKLVGLIVILLIPPLLYRLRSDRRSWLRFVVLCAAGFLSIYLGSWWVHFHLTSEVRPELPRDGYYEASDPYRQVLAEGGAVSFKTFPLMLREHLRFSKIYMEKVPALDLCKSGENGSPFFFWPFGGRAINYRWETPDQGKTHRYLYLQANPFVWLCGLAGVVGAGCLLLASILCRLERPLANRFLLTVFFGVYGSYMIAVSQIERVMYLYHYFTPLVLSFLLFGLVALEIEHAGRWQLSERGKQVAAGVFVVLVLAAFNFYRPLTYYEPLTPEQFQRRAIFALWNLRCIQCPSSSNLLEPCAPPTP